jgi:hypothetical protein
MMQLLGDLDILSFVRISRLKWIGHVNRMDSKGKASQIFKNYPQGSRLRGRPKTDVGTVYKLKLINVNLKTGYRGQKQSGLGEVH